MSEKEPVLFFIETAEPGGAERVVVELALVFRERGHRVGIVTLQEGWLTEELTRQCLPFEIMRSTRRWDIGLIFRLARYLRNGEFAVLHSHLLDANFYGAFAAKLAGIRHVATDHGDVHLPERKHLLRMKIWFLALLRVRCTAVSHYTVQRLQQLGISAERVSCIGNPLAPAPDRDEEARQQIRGSLGIVGNAEEHWVWIHVAILFPVKNQRALLQAFAEAFRNNTRRQTLLIAGDGPERQALQQLCTQLGLNKAVHFLGFRQDISRYLQAADGFVLSSFSESLPMALLEAANYGLCCVSTAVGGVTEIIEHERSGLLVQSNDVTALAQAITRVAEDSSWSIGLGATLRETVRRRFHPDVIYSEYLKLFQVS